MCLLDLYSFTFLLSLSLDALPPPLCSSFVLPSLPPSSSLGQDEVASLRRALRQREAQLSRKNGEVGDLRAQVAAGAFM